MLLRVITLSHILVQTWTLAPSSSLIWSNSLLAALPLINIIILSLTKTSLRSSVLLLFVVFLRYILDVLILFTTMTTIHLLILSALHISEARIKITCILGCLIANEHSHVGIRWWQLLFLLSSIGAC